MKTNFILAAIIVVAFVLRIAYLESWPQAINQDEAAKGYNAYTILKTGRAFRGQSWPLAFTDFSDRQPNYVILYNYLVVPSVAVFGLNPFAIRLPAALIGTATIYFLYLLTKQLFKQDRIALLAAGMLAISPWHLLLSRLGLEPITLPFFFFLGWFLLLKSARRPARLLPALVFLALTLYAYQAAVFITPVFLLSHLLAERKLVLRQWPYYLTGLVVFTSLLLPFINQVRLEPNYLSGHFNYMNAFSPGLISGLRYLLASFTGHLILLPSLVLLPTFLLLASSFIVNRKKDKTVLWVQGLLFLSIVPSSATFALFIPEPNRAVAVNGLMEILAAWAFFEVYHNIRKSLRLGLAGLISAFIMTNWLVLIWLGFPDYLNRVYSFGYGLKALSQHLHENENQYQKIYITNTINQPFIYLLFYQKIEPEKYFNSKIQRVYTSSSSYSYEAVTQLNRYYFCDTPSCCDQTTHSLCITPDSISKLPAN